MSNLNADIDKAILYHVGMNHGCTLNSITWNMARSGRYSHTNWPTKQKDFIVYVDNLVKSNRLTLFEMVIPGRPTKQVYFPANVTITRI